MVRYKIVIINSATSIVFDGVNVKRMDHCINLRQQVATFALFLCLSAGLYLVVKADLD